MEPTILIFPLHFLFQITPKYMSIFEEYQLKNKTKKH